MPFTVLHTDNGRHIKAWIDGVYVEDDAIEMAKKIMLLPFVKAQCLMPDAHVGKGCNIGTVLVTKDVVFPAFTGVDIGCGMIAIRFKLKRQDVDNYLDAIFQVLQRNIPHGRTDNGGEQDIGRWKRIPDIVRYRWQNELQEGYNQIIQDCPSIHRGNQVTFEHLGTLGGGNHFIEISVDTENNVWAMIHSGSRGVGARIGNTYIQIAKELCDAWKIDLPTKTMGYLPKGTKKCSIKEFDHYMYAAQWAQKYAKINREIMAELVIDSLQTALWTEIEPDLQVSCHHNYITYENHNNENVLVTRKGAILARQGVLGIIPGAMGAKSFIVEGKGSKDSYDTCSHGAGRAMSRTKAEKEITVEEHQKNTEGIVCCKDKRVLEESTRAYKNIDDVMAVQNDLVIPVAQLKQLICVKGLDE